MTSRTAEGSTTCSTLVVTSSRWTPRAGVCSSAHDTPSDQRWSDARSHAAAELHQRTRDCGCASATVLGALPQGAPVLLAPARLPVSLPIRGSAGGRDSAGRPERRRPCRPSARQGAPLRAVRSTGTIRSHADAPPEEPGADRLGSRRGERPLSSGPLLLATADR